MGEDKRRDSRRNLRVQYRATDTEGIAEMHFESADVSPGGTFLLSDVLLEVGDGLQLTFTLPGTERAVRVAARVAWVKRFPKDGEPAGMGMQFLSMSDADRAALEKYLADDSA